ncbi:MAG: DUF3822 family protein, partial [Paramuribaculum sp.]|nr:DUF3822 family protein [Paramuribaculum sp.]
LLRKIFVKFATMLQAKLEKDLISQPELWRLALMIGHDSFDVAIYPPVAREEVVWRSFPLDPNAPSRLKAIEDIIYDNPLLLCDFRKIDCVINPESRLIVPSCASPEQYEMLFSAACPSSESLELTATEINDDTLMLEGFEPEITAFLKRTFFNVTIRGRLPLLISYFIHRAEGLRPKRAVTLITGNRLTLIALDGNRLLAANEFQFNEIADAAYYVMAALNHIGFKTDGQDFDLAVHGQSLTSSESLAAVLRNYVAEIRPVPFPSLRFRATKTTLQAPFPLIILPICE